MGNTLTSCTSGNKEDRPPKTKAPIDRPIDKPRTESAADAAAGDAAENGAAGSSFVKNIDIRKSLRAARKSISKPFKKSKARDRGVEVPEGGVGVAVEEVGDASGGEEVASVAEVETHVADDAAEADADAATADAAAEAAADIAEVAVDDAATEKAEKENEDNDGEETEDKAEKVEEEAKEDAGEAEEEEAKKEEEADKAPDDADKKDDDKNDATDGVLLLGDAHKTKVIKALFNKYDKDGTGALKRSEMRKLLTEELGLDAEESKLVQALVDKDASKDVTLEEFQDFMKQENIVTVVKDNQSYRLLTEALRIFKQHDDDDSGKLSKEELSKLLTSELGIPGDQAASVLIQFDTTGDEQIGFQEFVNFLPPTSYLLK